MTLAGLFRRKRKPPPQDMGQVLNDVKHFVAELNRQTTEIDRQLTTLKEYPHG